MDTDLFQILTLILLLGLLLTLFGVLQSLGAIRRTLEGRGAGETAMTPPAAAETPSPVVETATRPEPEPEQATSSSGGETPAEAEPARTGWPAPQEAAATDPESAATTPAASSSPSSTGGTGARVLYGDAGLTTATPNDAALRTSEPEPEPEPEGTPVATAATDASAGSAAEDPQEQPFERDGRWWFRRGDELLVYEDQTGQWVAAPEPSPSSSGGAATEGGGTPAEGQVTTQQEAVAGSFWKCPSCGAVNGSTATSCRMCFTARP